MATIQNQSLIYHLTSLDNLESILTRGLLPRAQLNKFIDVADPAIIADRSQLNLEHYVPFHFFAKNPFDGRVQKDHPELSFVLITVQRQTAREHEWKIIPRHPLAGGNIEVMDYDEGFAAIDWATMNKRDYSDSECRSVCMAECIAPGHVPTGLFSNLYVRDESTRRHVHAMVVTRGIAAYVNVNDKMFVK